MEAIEKRCLELFARDYKYSIIHNANGEVCGHYPRQIVFLEYECTDVERDRYHSHCSILTTLYCSLSIIFRYKVQTTRLQITFLFVCVTAQIMHT